MTKKTNIRIFSIILCIAFFISINVATIHINARRISSFHDNKSNTINLDNRAIALTTYLLGTPVAKAWVATIVNQIVANVLSVLQWVWDIIKELGEKLANLAGAQAVTLTKIAALLSVQAATMTLIGDGPSIISDYNKYLYKSPQQRATIQMNLFFTASSGGRVSGSSYEGVGPNYNAYLVKQAQTALQGQKFVTNLQDQVSDPKQMFANGNMKGFVSFFECANNPICFVMTAEIRYAMEFDKAQIIAKAEQNNGFLPGKKNGKITRPASLMHSMFTQVDQMGTNMIMGAQAGTWEESGPALTEIAMGTAISGTARTLNYFTSNEKDQAEIRDGNDQFPFSLNYSDKNGVGITATNGGASTSTGIGAGAIKKLKDSTTSSCPTGTSKCGDQCCNNSGL